MKKPFAFLLLAASLSVAACRVPPPAPYGACPSPDQVAWQQMEMNLFCHFGPNTFTGAEWGDGTEPEDVFNAQRSAGCQRGKLADALAHNHVRLNSFHLQ